jgi:hypothetical protein
MFSIGFLTLDIIIWIAIILGFFFWSIHSGKKVLAKFILSFYPATLIFFTLPWNFNDDYLQIAIYVAIYAIVYIFLKRNFTAKRLYSNSRKTIDGVVLGISSALILILIYYHVLPIDDLYSFTLPFSNFLTETIPLAIWMIVPLAGLVLTNKSDE